jgi:hypothetical protein
MRSRYASLADHDDIKSLRDEIALARMLVERRLNMIKDDSDLLSACGPINTLLLTIERLVKSANVLEERLGILLAKQSILRLGQRICQIIIDRLVGLPGYEAVIDDIVADIVKAIKTADNEPAKLLPPPEDL